MLRKRNLIPAAGLTVLVALAALFVVSSATGKAASAPTNTQEPFISAPFLVTVGTTMTGHEGTWKGTQPITYTYQWKRCNNDGQACNNISGANDATYTVKQADVGYTLRFAVTAKNSDGKTAALSNATGQVPGSSSSPQQTAAPTISGQATVGQTLTATTGSWKGTQPITYTIKWQRCDDQGEHCSLISGAVGTTYTVKSADAGKRIRIKVVAKNDAGQTAGLSEPTEVVPGGSSGGGGGGGGGTGNAIPVADVGPTGARLIVDKVVFNPNPVTSRSVPIHVTITVKDTAGKLVQGALVFIRSTPIVTSTPTDAPTGSDGTVSYNITPRSDFPIKNGYSVQFFVKAYRSGDPSLAGISGTRLVQVATHTP